jgi:hypothetical protein
MTDEMRALCMGVHVLDVLVRPVEAIPEGQGGELVEDIRRDAAVLGCAAAGLVAEGLGTDHGDFDLAAVERMAA